MQKTCQRHRDIVVTRSANVLQTLCNVRPDLEIVTFILYLVFDHHQRHFCWLQSEVVAFNSSNMLIIQYFPSFNLFQAYSLFVTTTNNYILWLYRNKIVFFALRSDLKSDLQEAEVSV